MIRFKTIDPAFYAIRDDGLITMSVGRHVAEFGFVGVSPSGPIVESSSSALQTILAAIVHLAAPVVDYRTFAQVQTWVVTAVLGTAFVRLLPVGGIAAIGMIALSVLCLTFFSRFNSGTVREWRMPSPTPCSVSEHRPE